VSGRSTGFRVAVLVGLVAVAAILFVVLRPDSSGDEAEAPKGLTIVVEAGKPAGGVTRLAYTSGEQIRFSVRSDVADEVHVHGYDLMKDVPAGGTVTFDFPAKLEGDFEVELESRKQQIADLRVNPG
jgi:hypothetical protein